MDGLIEDTREAIRSLRRDAKLTLFVTLLFGLGIGATATIFSVFDALVLRPLPVSRPDSLVWIGFKEPNTPIGGLIYWEVFDALTRETKTLDLVAAAHQNNAGFRDGTRSRRVRIELASASFFTLFEARPVLGRTLTAADETPEAELAAVLSYRFWQRHYAADPAILGRKVLIQNQPAVIAGVMDPTFHGANVETSADIWLPARSATPLRLGRVVWSLFARIRPGVSAEAARLESQSIVRPVMQQTLEQFPAGLRAWRNIERQASFVLEPIPRGISRLRDLFSEALYFLLGASAVLVALTFTSVAGLLLARFAARTNEFSTRLALGASPGRLFRTAALQSLLLALCGGLAGLILTGIGTAAVPLLLPPVRLLDATAMPLVLDLHADARLLAFLFLLTIAAAILTAAAPAWKAARTNPASALGAARVTGAVRGRLILVALEVAICTTLAIAAGQLTLTLWNLRAIDPGFHTTHIVSFAVDSLISGLDRTQARRALDQWKREVQALPGVEAAALSSRPLLSGAGFRTTFTANGEPAPPSENANTSVHAVTGDYFETLGLRLLDGRTFRPEESIPPPPNSTADRPIIVNETFAKRFFPNEPAAGKRVGPAPPFHILGVFSDARYRSLREPVPPTMYTPVIPLDSSLVLHVRTRPDPALLIRPVQQILDRLAPGLPIHEIATMEQDVGASLATEQLVSTLAGTFAFLAALIAATGLFGLISFHVSQRVREIAIRVAIGARRSNIVLLVSCQTLAAVAAGIALGVAGVFAARPIMDSLLFGLRPNDPPTIAAACLAVLAAGIAAAAIPVWRALRIQPAATLRQDG